MSMFKNETSSSTAMETSMVHSVLGVSFLFFLFVIFLVFLFYFFPFLFSFIDNFAPSFQISVGRHSGPNGNAANINPRYPQGCPGNQACRPLGNMVSVRSTIDAHRSVLFVWRHTCCAIVYYPDYLVHQIIGVIDNRILLCSPSTHTTAVIYSMITALQPDNINIRMSSFPAG